MVDLPVSEKLNVEILGGSFDKTTNSYKFLWLRGIISCLRKRNYEIIEIPIREVIQEMIVYAWIPSSYYKLSLGYWDKTKECIDLLKIDYDSKISESGIRYKVNNNWDKKIEKKLKRHVVFRYIRCWFKGYIESGEEHGLHDKLINLSNSHFNEIRPLYKIPSKICGSIVMHSDWVRYFEMNESVIDGWLSWKWLEYLQGRNQSVPNVSKKLSIPDKRSSLRKQSEIWSFYLRKNEIRCIYSGDILDNSAFTLDHFVPWSYVAHDEIWNLIPTTRSANSSKNNSIPSVEYFDRFIVLQCSLVKFCRSHLSDKDYEKYISSYFNSLGITFDEIADDDLLCKSLRTLLSNLADGAKRLGFQPEWKYVKQPNPVLS